MSHSFLQLSWAWALIDRLSHRLPLFRGILLEGIPYLVVLWEKLQIIVCLSLGKQWSQDFQFYDVNKLLKYTPKNTTLCRNMAFLCVCVFPSHNIYHEAGTTAGLEEVFAGFQDSREGCLG